MTGSTRIEIKCENWPSYQSYGVFCSATLSHDDDSLLVLFDVVEPEVKADCWDYNQHVCNDSCVELFLQNPALGPDYVNFEFSASGYCLVARGDRPSAGWGKRVDLGGRRFIKKARL